MLVYERIIGILYIPIHAVLIPSAIVWVARFLGYSLDNPTLNLIYYGFGALLLLLSMNRYWRATIRDFTHSPIRTIQAIVLGFVAYWALNYAVYLLMALFTSELTNPNTAAVTETMAINKDMMLVVMILLAPVAEETMFRGALFGTLRKKNRILAYAVSSVVFAVYHLWGYTFDGGWSVLIYVLQYIPASLALAWCYEWSGTLVAPVVMHALVNFIAAIDIVWR